MGEMDILRGMRKAYQAGTTTSETVIDVVADMAFNSGARGDFEETFTALAFEYITDKTYVPDDWA